MFVKVLLQSSFVLLMRLRFAVLVMRRFICVTSLLVDIYVLDLLPRMLYQNVTFAKMHLFPGDKYVNVEDMSSQGTQGDQMEVRREPNQSSDAIVMEKEQNHVVHVDGNGVSDAQMDNKMIDLNARPQRTSGQSPNNNQTQGMDYVPGTNGDSASVVPVRSFKSEPEK